jgi:hypothetical protein
MGASAFIRELLQDPIFMHFATRDEQQHLLYTTMFFGADIVDGSNILKLFIPLAGIARIRHLIQSYDEATVLMTSVITYQCVQIKGRLLSIRQANASEEAVPSEMLQRIALHNYPEKLFSMKHYPLLTVELEIREVYNQTPGEEAGERLVF